MQASADRQTLKDIHECEVLIVGGGINGCGLLRELSLQDIECVLVTKEDFGCGATSAPSRMIHGGLRYLEQAEFRLVKESLKERNYLLKHAHHYVYPLPTTIPIFGWTSGLLEALKKLFRISSKTGKRGALWVKIGLSLYDFYTRKQRLMPAHFFTSRKKSLEKFEYLTDNIVSTATYYDAWVTLPERLCYELVTDARKFSPSAKAFNYVSLEGFEGYTVTLKCELTGETHPVRPRVLVNATGAWIDQTNSHLNHPTSYIGGTKGSHIVINHPALHDSLKGEMILYENPDGRVCLVFPFHGKVLAGSTDIPIQSPDDGICTDDEVDYILESIRNILPDVAIDKSDIIYRFCGVRPLPRSNVSTPGQVSRDHSCILDPETPERHFPIYSLVGGKWTTFRAFAEQVCDKILPRLPADRKEHTPDIPIGGAENLPANRVARAHWAEEQYALKHFTRTRQTALIERYGSKAESVANFILHEKDQPLLNCPDYTRREILYLITHEDVVRLADILDRRTSIAILGGLNKALIEEVADLCADALRWDSARKQTEIQIYLTQLRTHNGITF